LTDILTEISGERGQKQANSGKIRTPKNEERIWLDPAYLKGLIKKMILETLVEVAGVEPAGESASFPVSICDSSVLSEALTEILTEISGEGVKNRQILAKLGLQKTRKEFGWIPLT